MTPGNRHFHHLDRCFLETVNAMIVDAIKLASPGGTDLLDDQQVVPETQTDLTVYPAGCPGT